MPRLPQIRWTGSQVKRLRDAVSSFNRTITNLLRRFSGTEFEEVIPNKVTVNEMKSLIHDRKDLAYVEKDLTSILKKNDPTAQEIGSNGQLNWTRKAHQRQNRRENERTKKAIEQSYGSVWDDMTQVEKATAMSNKNIREVKEDDYTTPDELIERWSDYANTRRGRYVDNYIDVLKRVNTEGDFVNDLASIIEEIQEIDPEYLYNLFEYPYESLSIDYIYVESTDKTAYAKRKKTIQEFWYEQADRFGIPHKG